MNGAELPDGRATDGAGTDDDRSFSSLAAWLSAMRTQSGTAFRPLATAGDGVVDGRAAAPSVALAKALDAVAIYEGLAEQDPTVYLPDLARSLGVLSDWLVAAGRREEGVTVIERAIAIGERLAEVDPAFSVLDLGRWWNSLWLAMTRLGRDDDGLAAVERAVTIFETLAERNPTAYLPDLARTLHNRSIALAHLGRHDESLVAVQRAVTIYEGLADRNPDAYRPLLAQSLNNLSMRLAWVGRQGESVMAVESAVAIYEELADSNPAAYRYDLAVSLTHLAESRGRFHEAASEPPAHPVSPPLALAAPAGRHTPVGSVPDMVASDGSQAPDARLRGHGRR